MAWPGLSSRRSPENTRPAMTRRCAAARVSASPRSTSATSSRVLAIRLAGGGARCLAEIGLIEADGDAVGILDDGIARAPEGIPWRLQAAMAGRGHLAIEAIDLLARADAEPHDHAAGEVFAAGPSLVPDLGEGRAVEIERRGVGRIGLDGADVMRAGGGAPYPRVGNVDTQPAIEGDGCIDIAAYNVQLIERRPRPVHGLTPHLEGRNT